jgi:hypothetical protein
MSARDAISGGWVWEVVAKPPFQKNPLVICIDEIETREGEID